MHETHRVLDRHPSVGVVLVVKVDTIDTEPLKAAVKAIAPAPDPTKFATDDRDADFGGQLYPLPPRATPMSITLSACSARL